MHTIGLNTCDSLSESPTREHFSQTSFLHLDNLWFEAWGLKDFFTSLAPFLFHVIEGLHA